MAGLYGEDDDEAPASGPVESDEEYKDEKTALIGEALQLWSDGDKRRATESMAEAIEMCVDHRLEREGGEKKPPMGPGMRGKKRAPEALLLMAGQGGKE